jgi:hyperosmotically inducible periplasmic protein
MAAVACSVAMLLGLAACGERTDGSDGVPQAAQSADHASVQPDAAAPSAPPVQQSLAPRQVDTSTMGAAAADPVATEDQRIAADVKQALASDPDLGAMKIDVQSEFGLVTLRGRAPDPQARDRAGEISRTVAGVKTVDNMLTLG